MILLSLETDVLGRAYADSNLDLWQQFQPISIDGQPAVLHSFGPPGQNLMCEVVVGTGPNQGTVINASGSDQTVDRCAVAVKAAEFVVGNLRG